MPAQDDENLGRIAVHYKLATAAQLEAARAAQDAWTPLAEVLLAQKVITTAQHEWLMKAMAQYAAKAQAGAPLPSRPSTPAPSVRVTATAPQPAPAPSRPAAPTPGTAPAPSGPRITGAVPGPLTAPPRATGTTPAFVPAAPPSAPSRSTTTTPAFVPAAPPSAPAPSPALATVTPAVAAASQGPRLTLAEILGKAMQLRASDVHIHSGAAVQLRVGGALAEFKSGMLTAEATQAMLMDALPADRREQLQEGWDLDFALVLPKVGRFRASFYKQQRGWDAVFRPIPPEPPTLDSLGLPHALKKLTEFHQGLVLVTGPAGSGKSSTLAALVRLLNETRTDHIITVEDPTEFVHTPQGCLVNQREVNRHTKSFANALRAALREDPDIIVIGELRDLETISLAITAAETGHLVLGTLHTNNAVRTINRILDAFPPKQQSQIRAMVSESLRAIMSQRLVPSVDPGRRVVAHELLFVKPAVSNLIREEKTFQIRSIMQTGRSEGMCLLDDSLFDLVKAGRVSKDVARRFAEDPRRFA